MEAQWAEFAIKYGREADVDPRLILAIVLKESSDPKNTFPIQEYQMWSWQYALLGAILDSGGSSLGIANIKADVYHDTVGERHPEHFGKDVPWESVRYDADLSIHVLAWHLSDTLDSLRTTPTKLRGVTPNEAAAVEYQTGIYTRYGGREPTQVEIDKATSHLQEAAAQFTRADWIICGSGAWAC